MSEQDKPYKSIDLTFDQLFALKYALRDRKAMLVQQLEIFLEYPAASSEAIEEVRKQIDSIATLLASLELK